MKRAIYTLIGACLTMLVWVLPAQADLKLYKLSLGSAISGNTTTTKSTGTSIFAVTEGYDILRSGASEIPIAGGKYALVITGVTASQAQQGLGGDYSGVTLCLYVLGTFNDVWTGAEKIPIAVSLARSGNTVPPIVFYAPEGSKMRVEMGPTGVTAYDGLTANLYAEVGNEDHAPRSIVAAEASWTMPAAGTGVSEFTSNSIGTLPEGAEWFVIQGSASYYFTTDGSTPTTSSAFAVTATPYMIYLTAEEARKFKAIGSGVAVTLRYQALSRKP